MNPPTKGISVIVPVYNREKFLKECLDSILAQEYDGPMEIIVCDDGSTDKSLEIADSYGPPLVVLRKPEGCKDQGPGPTRNRGIAASQYPYIAFLDSDDLFLPGHLKRLAEALEQNPQYPIVVDLLLGTDEFLSHRWKTACPDTGEVQLETMFLKSYFVLQAGVFRKSFLDSLDYIFDEELQMGEDVDFYLRVLEHQKILIIHETGVLIREHEGRSIRNTRRCYSFAQLAMEKAIRRYPYPRWLVRKRKAVLAFRFAQADIAEKKYLKGLWNCFKALCLDPVRAIRVVLRLEPMN